MDDPMDTTTSTSTASAASITAATTEATITARPAPGPTSSSSSNPPQRQSCDRCHKQKLRCIRNKNQNGGVCDRCLSKRAQCVYSYSLPKGRPSLHRLADESNGNAARAKSRAQSAATSTTGTASEPLRAPDTINAARTESADAGARVTAPQTQQIQIPPCENSAVLQGMGLIDPAMDLSTGTWPWLETAASGWDQMQLEIDWSSHDSNHVNNVLASMDIFPSSDESTQQSPAHSGSVTSASPTLPPYTAIPSQPPAYAQSSHAGSANHHHNRSKEEMRREIEMSRSSGPTTIPAEKQANYTTFAITQLSQLSMRLSSLRCASYVLAQAAETSRNDLPHDRRIPLIHAAAFESVTGWLALHDQCATKKGMQAHAAAHVPEMANPYPTPPPSEPDPNCGRDGFSILRDVFCASHTLLEVLRHVHVNNMAQPQNGLTGASASAGDQCGITSVIRHLVMACDALLLEIYAAVLIALQHDAQQGSNSSLPAAGIAASINLSPMSALGDVRLVLVVQLCSYLIDRQHQAVDQCFAPLAVSSTSMPQMPGQDATNREALSELRQQVQQRMACLRQTLRCT